MKILSMKNTSKFLSRQASFSKNIMILEELQQSDTIFLDLSFNLIQQFRQLTVTNPFLICWTISWFSSFSSNLELIFIWISIIKEKQVLDISFFISINMSDCFYLFITHYKTKVCKNLSKLFGRYFKMTMSIKILEEWLRVQSLLKP